MPFIRETVITTRSRDGVVHVAPMGVTVSDMAYVIAPFRPSRTLENLRENPAASINYTDDVRVFAGCVSKRRTDWPTLPAVAIDGVYLEAALSHDEVEVVEVEEDDVRPRFHCRSVGRHTHRPFLGFNRAQAAVIEAAILVSRLHMLPADKIDREMEYLQIAIDKTASALEQEAWEWLTDRIEAHRADQAATAR